MRYVCYVYYLDNYRVFVVVVVILQSLLYDYTIVKKSTRSLHSPDYS